MNTPHAELLFFSCLECSVVCKNARVSVQSTENDDHDTAHYYTESQQFANFMTVFGAQNFWYNLWKLVARENANFFETTIATRPPMPLLQLSGMFEAIQLFDNRTCHNQRRMKKLLPLLITSMSNFFMKNKAATQLTLAMAILNGTGREVVARINQVYGPLVKGLLPVRRTMNSVRCVLRGRFMTDWQPTVLQTGIRVSLVDSVCLFEKSLYNDGS